MYEAIKILLLVPQTTLTWTGKNAKFEPHLNFCTFPEPRCWVQSGCLCPASHSSCKTGGESREEMRSWEVCKQGLVFTAYAGLSLWG